MRAILLIDHGSVRTEANHMLECMANLVRAMAGEEVLVEFAHMELAPPTIDEGFARCVESGATDVVVFPYMLSPGKHSTRDIPRMVAAAAARFPGVPYVVTSAFGVHDKLAEVVLERADVSARPAAALTPVTCARPSGAEPRYCGDGCRELAGGASQEQRPATTMPC